MRMALALSVLLHVLLLSIPMQGDVFGLSGLRFPWEERRLAASDLQIVLAPAAPAAPAAIPSPPAPSPPSASRTHAPAAVTPPVRTSKDVVPKPPARPKEAVAATVPPAPTRQADEEPAEVDLIALAREQAEREASARVEAERVAAHRREQERQAQLEAERWEQEATAQREAARQEEIQQELARQEQDRQEQARQEQARQEQARREQARQEQARQEQARQEQARLEEAQREQERARQAQASQPLVQPGPGPGPGPAQAGQLAPRAERLRAIAEQLAREAAARERTDSPSGSPQPTVSGLRRGWLFGRADPNQDLVQYAQAMGRKIELNRTLDMVREAVKQPHTQPVVTVAVRADGSVEKVTFETSSGVPAIDEGIRKIIASQAPFGPFPPALARHYDVVEIRRTWLFDVAVRLQ